ncbi:kinase-like protein [Stipitochalara longipes BDJ]|nr:kinase-like protein [Stipitochalara longipes BDJ]
MAILPREELESHGITWHKTEEGLYSREDIPVAEGSVGRVFKALFDGQVVAVKMIKLTRMTEDMQLRAVREYKILKDLQHSNVLRGLAAYYVDIKKSIVLVTTPWAPVTLYAFLEDINENNVSSICPWYAFGSLKPWPELIRQLMEGLQYLHTREPPIKHRDLNPDNILVHHSSSELFPQLIIADFSISKEVIADTHTTRVYTYLFRTPEQREGKPTTVNSDVYQLGCCLIFIEGVLHCGKEGFQQLHDMVIGDNPEKKPGFEDNLARLHVFLDQKTSEYSSTTLPYPPIVLFGRKLRELVKQMVMLDPNERPSISSALDKLRIILRPKKGKRYTYIWHCCQSGTSTINIVVSTCPECGVPRCASCPTEKIQVR